MDNFGPANHLLARTARRHRAAISVSAIGYERRGRRMYDWFLRPSYRVPGMRVVDLSRRPAGRLRVLGVPAEAVSRIPWGVCPPAPATEDARTAARVRLGCRLAVRLSSGVATAYDAERFATRKGRFVDYREQSLIRGLVGRAAVRPPAAIVDIPVGTGRLSMSLASDGFRMTGVDVWEQMIDRAAERWSAWPEADRPALVVGDAESLPFEDASFDVVVSLRLLGHLPPETRLRVLREFRRVTRENVIIAFYNRTSIQGFLRRRRRGATPWHPVTLAEIDAELAAGGLRRIGRRFMLPFVSETIVVLARGV